MPRNYSVEALAAARTVNFRKKTKLGDGDINIKRAADTAGLHASLVSRAYALLDTATEEELALIEGGKLTVDRLEREIRTEKLTVEERKARHEAPPKFNSMSSIGRRVAEQLAEEKAKRDARERRRPSQTHGRKPKPQPPPPPPAPDFRLLPPSLSETLRMLMAAALVFPVEEARALVPDLNEGDLERLIYWLMDLNAALPARLAQAGD